ncbi:hypothetical protein [Amycolatopsis sp. 3B14]|uniref:hypothetical protein n=1 Tax=Amycolatopsis sp. 3B14 TaxID=3243600 RepID=UPI003D963853
MPTTAENPTAETAPEVPLPPAPPEATLAKPDMFMPLEADSFKPIAGFPAADLRPLPAVAKYSGGLANAFVIKANPEYKWQGAPWHTHHLNVHFNYIVKGWALFEFEGVGTVRLEAGTAFYQPPRNRHRELDASSDFEVIAVELPASYPTTFYALDPETGEYRATVIDAETEGGELTNVVKVDEAG